jgi:hypothetical protein
MTPLLYKSTTSLLLQPVTLASQAAVLLMTHHLALRLRSLYLCSGRRAAWWHCVSKRAAQLSGSATEVGQTAKCGIRWPYSITADTAVRQEFSTHNASISFWYFFCSCGRLSFIDGVTTSSST